jgi:hypothetical protein
MRRESRTRRFWVAVPVLLLEILVQGTVVPAQTVHGTLAGVVSDPTGAVVPGAKVNVVNSATGTTYNGTTTSIGLFRFEDVALGEYNITVTATGQSTPPFRVCEQR